MRYLRSPTCRFLVSVAIVVLKQGTVCKHKGSGRIPDHAHHPKKHIHHLHQKAVQKLSTVPSSSSSPSSMMISHPPPHLQTCKQITSSSSSSKTLLANTKARTRSRSRCKFGQEAFSWEKIDAQSRRNTFRHHHLNHYHHL